MWPGASWREPTRYTTPKATTGATGVGPTRTVSPLPRCRHSETPFARATSSKPAVIPPPRRGTVARRGRPPAAASYIIGVGRGAPGVTGRTGASTSTRTRSMRSTATAGRCTRPTRRV